MNTPAGLQRCPKVVKDKSNCKIFVTVTSIVTLMIIVTLACATMAIVVKKLNEVQDSKDKTKDNGMLNMFFL